MGISVVAGVQVDSAGLGSLPQKQACPVVAFWQMIWNDPPFLPSAMQAPLPWEGA
ncbi:MAG: hypothetical protein JSR31_05610 [Nitrospira sp.]|nr:hypothetical protein [Nitrospira sp.]